MVASESMCVTLPIKNVIGPDLSEAAKGTTKRRPGRIGMNVKPYCAHKFVNCSLFSPERCVSTWMDFDDTYYAELANAVDMRRL